MNNLNKVISTAKKLINLPYNKFNLDNYQSILETNHFNLVFSDTDSSMPIKLMSGLDETSGIIRTIGSSTKSNRNIYIVGKGILFDSGGYNLKTGRAGPYGMHGDKAGMIIALSVANYLRKNVIAYCPVTTNFLHSSKIIPGDILKIGNKTVEVNNKDAEGRLILAEAINNLNVSKNDIIITIATLTGCCEYAVDKATGVFGDNDSLINYYLEASKEEKEYAWRLPIFDYMQDFYKKQPIKNSVNKIIAGASEGAIFIKQFIKYPNNWIHLDIASSAEKGGKATGIPIKSLINFIRKVK
jgi:leucyl aminopeptidase